MSAIQKTLKSICLRTIFSLTLNEFSDNSFTGQSHEGRDMKVIEITKAGPGKPIAWIEAGIHAREWIARYYPTNKISANIIFDNAFSTNAVSTNGVSSKWGFS